MIQDPSNQYIAAILSQCDLSGKVVLEIGCGKGRITRDLARHARWIVATDPDASAIKLARQGNTNDNITFMREPEGVPDLTDGTVDVIIYTLSLHHVPVAEMAGSLKKATALLKRNGLIIVVEPGDKGSFTFVKEHYGAGSGAEGPAKEAAIRAMSALDGWTMEGTTHFYTQFQFDNYEDFFENMMPGYRQHPEGFVNEVKAYLYLHRTVNGFILDAERRLNVLRPTRSKEHPCKTSEMSNFLKDIWLPGEVPGSHKKSS